MEYMNPAVSMVNTDAVCAASFMDALRVSLPSTCTSSSGPIPLLTNPLRYSGLPSRSSRSIMPSGFGLSSPDARVTTLVALTRLGLAATRRVVTADAATRDEAAKDDITSEPGADTSERHEGRFEVRENHHVHGKSASFHFGAARTTMASRPELDHVDIVATPLVHDDVVKLVADDGAGAIVTFIGTTRNTFEYEGILRNVDRLEYECYEPMAKAKMRQLCGAIRTGWDVAKIAMVHRTGTVGVGESSVVIAVSSAHRREALEATHWAIDELKATVPIWKKEFFEGGEVWQENAEQRREPRTPPPRKENA